MYTKLFKIFVGQNKNLFILIFISLSLSLSGYIFSDSLTRNFVSSIENDAQENLGGDFVIDIGNSNQNVFEEFYKDFPFKQDVHLSREFSILSSVKENEKIVASNIIFHSDLYPFYYDLGKITTNQKGELYIGKDLFDSLEKKTLIILGTEFNIAGYYSNKVGGAFTNFLGTQNILINIKNYEKIARNDTNTLIEKKYYLKLKNQSDFDKIDIYLKEETDKKSGIIIKNYKNGGDRFSDIISNLRSYINYAVLFSFLLTSTIIFIAITSFFINERKSISVLKILGLKNINIILFISLLFIFILTISLLIGIGINNVIFYFIQTVELTTGFSLYNQSILQALIIGGVIIIGAISFPLIKFVTKNINAGLQEDFYGLFSRKESFISGITFIVLSLILSLFLQYSLIKSLFAIGFIIIFLIFFYITIIFTVRLLQRITKGLRKKYFPIYDSIRVANKPGNMTFLTAISFFIIFSIGFSLLILFGNFNDRLQINLKTDKNFFVINITEDTYQKLSPQYQSDSFSLIKGRILKINNKTLSEHIGGSPSREFTREFNITDNPLSNLAILEGEKTVMPKTISVDYDFSQNLGLKIGDDILMNIFGIEKELKIINIRESRDRSINPFFYFQVNQKEFANYPKQYFLSSYVDTENMAIIKREFFDISSGTATFIEVDKILDELKEISTKVLLVIQSLFIYIIIFCILSIIVVILFFSNQQKKSNYLYMLLGSNKYRNRIKNFSTYAVIATMMLLLTIVIVSPLSYYLLSFNTFINFNWSVYGISLSLIFLSYIVLLIGLWFGNKK